MKESDLYTPLKTYLESRGYEVKGEVGNCDVCARRNDEPPVLIELKLSLNLTVILQAVERFSLSDEVYVGIPRNVGALKRKGRAILKLFRRLGMGLITIDPHRRSGGVRILLDPGNYRPRVTKQRQARLLREFEKRVGDPNSGGADTRKGRMTAYRQSALRIARFLEMRGPTKASEVARQTEEANARNLLYRDVYGWFDRVDRGVYGLSPRGKREIADWVETGPDG